MGKAVTLDEQHYQVAADKARSRGQTPEQYLQELIDADARTFDEILHPVRQGFESMSDEEVDGLWNRAGNRL
ncbi:MAG TPA: hypothetical protein VIM11_07125 [Tepidisphaeraceae bacterium]|jgi:hypothetical protein